MKKMNKKIKHFSLMELVIVIGIMAGLAALAVPAFQSFQVTANINAAKTEIGVLATAVSQYNVVNGHYPSSLSELVATSNGGPFLQQKSVPKDPWGNDYQYQLDDTYGFIIISYGPDKQQGGDGNNADISNIK